LSSHLLFQVMDSAFSCCLLICILLFLFIFLFHYSCSCQSLLIIVIYSGLSIPDISNPVPASILNKHHSTEDLLLM
jgi:hypothetical protein